MKLLFRASALVLALAVSCSVAVAQINQGSSPLTIPKGGTGASTAGSARTNLGLGSMATQNANGVVITGGSITGLPSPSISADAANKQYVDSVAAGLTVHEATASGAAGSIQTTTGSITSGTNTLTLASAIDFKNTNGIRINHAGTAFATNPPTGLNVSTQGATGSTTYNYQIAAIDAVGGVGAAVAQVQVTNGNASLSTTNKNHIVWSGPSSGPAPYAYAVYASCPSCSQHTPTMTLVALVGGGGTAYDDIGFNYVWTVPDWLPTAPQGASLADWLVTSIASGATTTTLTLAASAGTTASSQFVDHDDTVAVQACISAASNDHTRCHISGGNYPISTNLSISGRMELFGDGIQGTQNYNYAFQGSPVLTRASAANAATIWPNSNATAITATFNDALHIHDFQIVFTSQPPPLSGVSALVISGTGGPYNVTQNCTTANTSPILTACQDTRFMAVNEQIVGPGIPAGAAVLSIDSATQIHMTANATASATVGIATDVIAGFNLTATTTSGSNTLTAMTNANLGITGGMVITGACVPFGTTVSSATSTTVVMSANATCNGTQPEKFEFGLMTNESIHDMLLSGGDRLLMLSNSTEFWVWNNKFYDGLTYSTLLDLDNGNGDWQYGPGNVNIAGSIYTMSHLALQSGGGGRIIGNKFNTAGSVNNTVTQGIYFNPVRDFSSIEPPTIVGNSLEGLNAGVEWFNSCPHPSSCSSTQSLITGNQMWNNTDILVANAGIQWIAGLVITGNHLNVNGGGGATNININNAKSINIVGNAFGNTTGGGSTAYSLNNCTNCIASGNMSEGSGTVIGSGNNVPSPGSLSCGTAFTNSFPNPVETYFFPGSGTGVTAITKNSGSILTQASAPAPALSIMMAPNDSITVTCTTAPAIGATAFNP
jgi:hypothetical protein